MKFHTHKRAEYRGLEADIEQLNNELARLKQSFDTTELGLIKYEKLIEGLAESGNPLALEELGMLSELSEPIKSCLEGAENLVKGLEITKRTKKELWSEYLDYYKCCKTLVEEFQRLLSTHTEFSLVLSRKYTLLIEFRNLSIQQVIDCLALWRERAELAKKWGPPDVLQTTLSKIEVLEHKLEKLSQPLSES